MTVAGDTAYRALYIRDSLLRVTSVSERIGATNVLRGFLYDSAGRLSEVREDGVVRETYEYDENGNRTLAVLPSGPWNATHDVDDRLTQAGGFAYSFDAMGRLQSRVAGADTTKYVYDLVANLLQVTLPAGDQIDYVVDGLNRRIGKRVNQVLVQGFLYETEFRPVAELDGTGQVRSRFVYGSSPYAPDYMIRDGETYQIISEPNGSVRLVVHATTGQVMQRLDYDAYGRVVRNDGAGFQPFAYAGGIYDSHTGLLRLGARDYDASAGRFTTKDPLGLAGGPNLYEYANGDPITFSDPLGMCPKARTGRPCQNVLDGKDMVLRHDIFSGFGESNQRTSGVHQGADILAAPGSIVTAADDGVVVHIQETETDLFGFWVTVAHRNLDGKTFTYTVYAHLDAVCEGLKEGDPVKGGDRLGFSGTSGNAKNTKHPHLHFEIRTRLNPRRGPGYNGLNDRLDPVPELDLKPRQ